MLEPKPSMLAIAIISIIASASLFSTLAHAGDSANCFTNRPNLELFNPQLIYQTGAVIDRLDASPQDNCFEQLTTDDRAFLKSLPKKLSSACEASHPDRCESAARKTLNDALENYRSKNGTAAKERVLLAIRAEAKKQQIGATLRVFQDPKVAPAFRKFSDAMVRYEKSLSQLMYQDIRSDDPESRWKAALVWMRQRTAMTLDLAKTKLSASAHTRYRENDLAAQQLLFSGIELNSKIKGLAISEEEKSRLVDQVGFLQSSMRERFESTQSRLESESKTAWVVAGGVESAALVIASAGSLGPAFVSALGGDISGSILGGVLSGATGGAGITGLTKASDMTLGAMAAAKTKASSFVCELARRVDDEGKDALKEVWAATWEGAALGGAFGGAFAGIAKKSPKLATVLGAILAAGGTVNSIADAKQGIDQISESNGRITKVRTAQGFGRASLGDVKDAEALAAQEKAHASARLIGDGAGAAALATGAQAARQGAAQVRAAQKLGRKNLHDETRAFFTQHHLNSELTTVEQNQAYIDRAKGAQPDGNTLFFDVENSVMKKMNDTLRDKNFVTSLTNLHKEIILNRMENLARTYPDLKIDPYTDYKSIRFAISGKIPKDFEAKLDQLFRSANEQYAEGLKTYGILRESDDPENYFRSGLGRTPDQANLAARYSRKAEGENRLHRFNDPTIQEGMMERLKQTENLRQRLASELANSPLVGPSLAHSRPTLSQEAFDILRKYSAPEDVVKLVKKRYGIEITTEQAQSMKSYAHSVDEFSPSIYVAKREVVNLDAAEHGGFTADFLGMGSLNGHATASALARARNLDSALNAAREGEQSVTQEFKTKVDAFRKIAGALATCSADDCSGIAKKALSRQEKETLALRFANDPRTASTRIAFVTAGVKVPAERSLLGTDGESIEKFLRKNLEGRIDYRKTKEILFAVDMKTKHAGKGPVDLIIAPKNGLTLSARELEEIRTAFAKAVEDHNLDVRAGGRDSDYRPSHPIR